MKKSLAQLKALSWYEWRLLLTAMLLLPLTALALHLFGFKRTQAFMSRFNSPVGVQSDSGEHKLQEARAVAHMVSIAANHGIYRANCLKQSLVLWWLLQRQGIPSEIKIGVNREGGEALNAHAWVECDGQILVDPEYIRQRFSSFENR